MTQKLKNIIQLLLSFDELSEEEQNAIANQVEKAIGEVKDTNAETGDSAKPLKKRIAGLEKGPYYIANDFDDPLPEFEKLLYDTSGIWEKGDGLDYQQSIREEWSGRNSEQSD